MKSLGFLILGLILGLCAARFFTRVDDNREWSAQGVPLIEKLPAENQLRAAEEYYGKAVVLFLASLAHRTKVESTINKPPHPAHDIPPQEIITQAERGELSKLTTSRSDEQVSGTEEKPITKALSYLKLPYAQRMSPAIRRLNGHYVGFLFHERGAKKGRQDEVVMNLNFFINEKNILAGDLEILISDPMGKLYSRKRTNSENDSLKLVPGKRDEFYVEPAPGDFIHFTIRDRDTLKGRYFDKKGENVGRVMVKRK